MHQGKRSSSAFAHGLRAACTALVCCTASASHAGIQPLDDQALTQVHGAGLDELLLARGGHEEARHEDKRAEQARQSQAAQKAAALLAAIEMQLNQGSRLTTGAVQTVGTVAQLGGTLIALTPVSALAPIGLFGLPSLPPGLRR